MSFIGKGATMSDFNSYNELVLLSGYISNVIYLHNNEENFVI